MQVSHSLCTEIESTLTKNQNSKKIKHQIQHFESNRCCLHAQSVSHQKHFGQQIKTIEHPTTNGISKIQDIAYQYNNFIKENSHTSTPQQYNGKKQEKFWSEIDLPSTSMELSDGLRVHAYDSCGLYNQNKVTAAQKGCKNNGSDINKQPEIKMKTEKRSTYLGKAVSQPHLLYEDQTNNTYNSLSKINYQNRNSVTEFTIDREKCKTFTEGMQIEKFHENSISGENLDLCKLESSLDIHTSVKRITLDKRLELENTNNALSENCENICKVTSVDNYKDTCMKQTNEIIQNYGQQEQKSLFCTDTNNITKKVEQTDLIHKNTLKNQSENLINSDKIKLNADQLIIQLQESGSDYDKTEQCSSVVDSGRGSATYSSDKKCSAEEFDCLKGLPV